MSRACLASDVLNYQITNCEITTLKIMRVAIIGAAGLLGKYILREWTGNELFALDIGEIDIRNPQNTSEVLTPLRPEWIVLTAALTDVDACESNPEKTMQTNCAGAVNVAKTAKALGARMLFVSTDYVFDGTASQPYETTDPRNPKTVYGRSKAEAEEQLLALLPEVCIARTAWLFGVQGKSFPDTILKLAQTRTEVEVVDDQRGCPTYARDLARAMMQLCRQGARGIVHVTNSGDCTWYEFAAEILRQAGSKTVVRPTTTDKFPRPAPRPNYSVLSGKSLAEHGIQMPRWQDAVHDYLAERAWN
jgi:dTDP-4-dehydrorhamnose reductase